MFLNIISYVELFQYYWFFKISVNWLKKLSFDNFSIFIPFLFKQQKIGSDFNSYGTKNKGEIQTKISFVLISIILWFILHNMMTICYDLHNVTIYTSIWLIHALTVLKECMFYNNCVYLLCNICCRRGGEKFTKFVPFSNGYFLIVLRWRTLFQCICYTMKNQFRARHYQSIREDIIYLMYNFHFSTYFFINCISFHINIRQGFMTQI